ncbi:MAG TPA: hypothetical protein VHN79_10550, partial [Lacunisphaera sp.]|nr:hypothetical protein [Lacunisphaera sp.]
MRYLLAPRFFRRGKSKVARHFLAAVGLGGLLLLSLGAADSAATAEKSLLERAYDLDEGIAGPRDAAAAAALYRQAAQTGDAFAHLRLGYLAETGDGVPQDYAAARVHYQAAVNAGLAEARVRLAICHLEGW